MNDTTLKESVLAELDWRPSIDAKHVGVSVDGGVVTLTGHVASYAAKYELENAVKRVAGVRAVAENIEVRLAGSSVVHDDEIAKRALQSLTWTVTVPLDSVKVKVEAGWVTLTGELDWQFQSNAAAAAVRTLQGVKGVSNQITLKLHPAPSDVKDRIEGALRRSAEVEAKGIRVDVANGTVTLAGNVRSWSEREKAADAAWMTPGVKSVVDHLQIA